MNRAFKLKDGEYDSSKPLIIAELGTSHGGDAVKARELIDAAVESGAGCVKVQIVYADEILHPRTGVVPLPRGEIALYEIFKRLETRPEFVAHIKEYTEARGALFLASPFGPRSAAELRELNPSLVKIASPELNYTALLDECAAWQIPMLLSCGVAKLAGIEAALDIIDRDEQRRGSLCLLHCVTAYPAPVFEYNLAFLPLLSALFGVSVGISDHSLEPCTVPLLALSQGACVIEKHFCLSRTDDGLDDPVALPPDEFKLMCGAIREAQRLTSAEIIALVKEQAGEALTFSVLGDGVKRLARSECANYGRTNRSIHALCDIKAGERFTGQNIAVLRTEKILRPGLAPSFFEKLIGRAAQKDIPAGEGVRFEDV